MILSIQHGEADLRNPEKECHETVFDYCVSRYKKLGQTIPRAENHDERVNILWKAVAGQNRLTPQNLNTVQPGYIIGFFKANGNCYHSMIALDQDIWVGTNNYQTFDIDQLAVVFYGIPDFTEKGQRRVSLSNDSKIKNIYCGAHWDKDKNTWKSPYEEYIVRYRDIITMPITNCDICSYK